MTSDVAQDFLRAADQYLLEVSNVCMNILLLRTLFWKILQIYMIFPSHIMQLLWVICVFCAFWNTMNRCLTSAGITQNRLQKIILKYLAGNHLFSTFRHHYFMNLDPMTVMACMFLLVVMLSVMNTLTAIYHPCGRDIIASLSLKRCTLLIRIRVNFYALFFIALQTQF